MAKLIAPPRSHAGWTRYARSWLLILLVLLWTTGLTMHLADRSTDLDVPAWQSLLRHGSTIVHGVLAWLFCVLIGRWVWPHVLLVWRRRAHGSTWWFGWLTLSLALLVMLTGLGLLYGNADWHDATSAVHWWLGLCWPLVTALHSWRMLARRH